MIPQALVLLLLVTLLLSREGRTEQQVSPLLPEPPSAAISTARANGVQFGQAVGAARRLLLAWLPHSDLRTGLFPDRVEDDRTKWVYTPHNSGADLYPYLVLTAQLTDPDLFEGRMLEILRNEIRFTSAKGSIPGDLTFATGELGAPSLFGAGEYAKDGLLSITEYLGRTPWFYRMLDLTVDAMAQSSVESRFGKLPSESAELNGDFLQILVRLFPMTGDQRFLEWARVIGDAYVEEVLPGNFGAPTKTWDFTAHDGSRRLRLRDHGNEIIVGLTLLFALEQQLGSDRAPRYRAAVGRMLDRILQSALSDGMLYDELDAKTLAPVKLRLSDNWGYIYGAVYTFYQLTGETKYRDAIRHVLASLPAYRNFGWEVSKTYPHPGSFDGYADAIESAIYLVNREPVPEALAWIDSEIRVMLGMQRSDGHIEHWYAEGNFNRTALLYAYMKSLGVRPDHWQPGVEVGAVRHGAGLVVSIVTPVPRLIQFDFARHRRVLNLKENVVRLNEFPEWFTVDENTLYRIGRAGTVGQIRLGSELIAGIVLESGNWILEPVPQR